MNIDTENTISIAKERVFFAKGIQSLVENLLLMDALIEALDRDCPKKPSLRKDETRPEVTIEEYFDYLLEVESYTDIHQQYETERKALLLERAVIIRRLSDVLQSLTAYMVVPAWEGEHILRMYYDDSFDMYIPRLEVKR